MRPATCLVFVVFVAFVMLCDAYPQGGPSGSSAFDKAAGKVLIHTSGIEKGHIHTANCFGFGQGGQQPPPSTTTTTTTASSK